MYCEIFHKQSIDSIVTEMETAYFRNLFKKTPWTKASSRQKSLFNDS